MLEIGDQDALEPGQVIVRRYRLDRIVGEGGMGVVWAATHVLTEKPCALKFLKGSRASNPRSHARMLHEARAAGRVRHPNVAQVHDILELPGGAPFIVMDLLEGEPLSARLARVGRLDVSATLDIVVSVMEAIRAAHALGVVHRDLKPDNVFLEGGVHGVVKVLDFGIAKRFDTTVIAAETVEGTPAESSAMRHGLTTTHSTIGTPSYMAPEQLRGEDGVGIAADVWALGLLAYECLTGSRPPRDDATGGVVEAAARQELARLEHEVPPPIVSAILQMTERLPERRPALSDVHEAFLAVAARAERAARAPTPSRVNLRTLGLVAALVVAGVAATTALRRAPEAKPDPTVVTTPLPPPSVAVPAVAESAPVASAVATTPAVQASAPGSSSASPLARKEARKLPPTTSASAVPSSIAPIAAVSASSHVIPSYERK